MSDGRGAIRNDEGGKGQPARGQEDDVKHGKAHEGQEKEEGKAC